MVELATLPSLATLPTLPAGTPSVQLTFTPALSPEFRTQLTTQPLTLTVTPESRGTQLILTTPNGLTFTATANPPLPAGTQLSISAELPPAPTLPLPAGAPPAPLPLTAKVLPPPPTAPAPTPAQPLPAASNALAVQIAANTSLATLIQATNQPQTTNIIPFKQQYLPEGPIPANIATPNPPQTPVSGTLTPRPIPPNASQTTQTAIFTPTPQPGIPPHPPIPVTLTLGTALPATPQPATLLPNPTAPTQPVLLLTQPTAPQPAASPSIPATLTVTLPPTPPGTPPPPLNTPISARILAPGTQSPTPGTAPLLLATGHTAVLQSSQPIPTGSVLVVEFPTLTSNAQIVRIQPADAQPHTPQPTTPQTAAPVAPQTLQAVVPPGTILQGAITGQNTSGQPLLSVAQPPNLAGQTIPLDLPPENTPPLPPGTQLSVRMENAATATILSLTLPPQAQKAHTLNTLGHQWQALQQGLALLQQQAPAHAAGLRAALPQLANLLPGLMVFTNALRTGKTEDAFGREVTTLLKAMGADLSPQIQQLAQLQQRPEPGADSQWRGTLFPYVEAPGDDPRQGGFFWRREKKDDPRAPTHTRFVVEVEMSTLGPLQLDGLITYPEIWLKLRRHTVPEDGFTANLQALVGGMLQQFGLQGGISVETTAAFPINPRAELLADTPNPLPLSA